MKKSYFVTGTDTGIGKTVISTILAVGQQAHYWKPVQTGSHQGTDTDFVRQWLVPQNIWPESYLFSEAVSPHLAAEIEGQEITLARCLADFEKIHEPVVIEGAGGVLVPLNRSSLMIDLIACLELSTIVVASTKLGTINHTLLTVAALKARKIAVAGVITVGDDNPLVQKSIREFGSVPVLGHVSHCGRFSQAWFQMAYRQLALHASKRSPKCQTI